MIISEARKRLVGAVSRPGDCMGTETARGRRGNVSGRLGTAQGRVADGDGLWGRLGNVSSKFPLVFFFFFFF
ncbi:hypothetical protein Hanom_Chr08g00704501 [Helianthus anomalus]